MATSVWNGAARHRDIRTRRSVATGSPGRPRSSASGSPLHASQGSALRQMAAAALMVKCRPINGNSVLLLHRIAHGSSSSRQPSASERRSLSEGREPHPSPDEGSCDAPHTRGQYGRPANARHPTATLRTHQSASLSCRKVPFSRSPSPLKAVAIRGRRRSRRIRPRRRATLQAAVHAIAMDAESSGLGAWRPMGSRASVCIQQAATADCSLQRRTGAHRMKRRSCV